MRGRRATPLLLLAGAVVTAAACADMPTAGEPFSLSFSQLPFTAVALGDSLRDTSGTAVPLAAQVFDADGNQIVDAPVTYLLLERGATLLEGGYVEGDSAGATVRVVAEAGGIPSLPLSLAVVLPPDSLWLETTDPDTALYQPRAVISTEDISEPIVVHVLHRPAEGEADGVPSWLVRYDVAVYDGETLVPNDSLALPVTDNGRLAVIDTTDAQGRASRRVLLNGARPAIDAVDSVVVSVTILGRLPGTVSPSSVQVAVPVRSR